MRLHGSNTSRKGAHAGDIGESAPALSDILRVHVWLDARHFDAQISSTLSVEPSGPPAATPAVR